MVRSLMPAFIITAAAEDSLMQFEKASDLNFAHSQSAALTRVSNMQKNSQQLEDQYKAMLMNVVSTGSWDDPKTGNPWVPDKALILDPVEKVVQDMVDELDEQKGLNTGIMGRHTDAIIACNTARDAALRGEVTNNKNAMVKDRKEHRECRAAEDAQIKSMEDECTAFDNIEKCGHEQNWYAAIETDGSAGSLAATISQANACRSGIADTKAQAIACDTSQDEFKGAFCEYASSLTDTCTTHDACYTTNTENWNAANSTIKVLESEQKTVYRMLGRIRCYLKLLFGAADKSIPPSQADISTCEQTAIDDKALNIDYGSVADKGKCYDAPEVVDESVDNLPGGAAWYDKEFSSMTLHNKLQSNSEC